MVWLLVIAIAGWAASVCLALAVGGMLERRDWQRRCELPPCWRCRGWGYERSPVSSLDRRRGRWAE